MANIIGDIAGQKKTLEALLAKMPQDEDIVLLGDLNDRGPNSKEVIEWAMNTPRVTTLHSNHGDMFVDFILGFRYRDYRSHYHYSDFFNNGGGPTMKSYFFQEVTGKNLKEAIAAIPMEHIKWLRDLPVKYELPGLLCTHAPFEESYDRMDSVWNRNNPDKITGVLQVFGHNAHWGLRWFDDWAVCIDTSRQKVLTGLHWPTKRIYQQEYITLD